MMTSQEGPGSLMSPGTSADSRRLTKAGPLLNLRGVSKYYGHVRALENVDFELYSGEVLALVGDNGAGKSTLIKIISGAVIPDRGEIFLDGNPARMRSPQDAVLLGIMTVYQHLALIDTRDVLANLFLGREPSRWGMIDRRKMQEDAEQVLFRVGNIAFPPLTVPVGILTGTAPGCCNRACFVTGKPDHYHG